MTQDMGKDVADTGASVRADISALVDGRDDAADVACAAWARDPEAREAWHTYQLIGDVLRSEDLALPAEHDARFLDGLRSRLREEPVVLAPSAVAVGAASSSHAARAVRPRWRSAALASGVAAGVAVMAGGVIVLRQAPPSAGDELRLAAQRPPAAVASTPLGATMRTDTAAPGPAAATLASSGTVIRDPRLDAYLRAHRSFGPVRPGGVGGRVETVVLER